MRLKLPLDGTRRRFLAGTVAGAAATALPSALFAQQRNLADARRHALVIGNAAYRNSPLRNPANDATDITAALERSGFSVVKLIDASRDAMSQAIRAYGEALTRDQAVGVFYFAGHGVQLSWRNFLVPVDAAISGTAEVPERTVDLVELVNSLKRAANPANLVILDACRNNPFGRDFIIQQQGLSQMDAPNGTLLAYATAPGNVAIDGEGKNGLYTSHLLREIAVPEAKVEDVFKRVRLAVRRDSKGLQVPWESTSLEDDLYFVPPKELRRLAEAEREKLFQQELQAWERVKASRDPAALEEFIRRYPSGTFSEPAQARLDQVLVAQGEKRVEVVSAPENPYSKGSARADTAFRVGDSYSWRISDLFTGVPVKDTTETITAITETEVIYNNGERISDLLGNTQRRPDGFRLIGPSFVANEFIVGRRWQTRFKTISTSGVERVSEYGLKIADRESITVPAGTFDCFRLEADGGTVGTQEQLKFTTWAAPSRSRRFVKLEFLVRNPWRVMISERWELLGFKQS